MQLMAIRLTTVAAPRTTETRAFDTAPPRFDVPARLAGELDSSAAAGRGAAAEWVGAHADATREQFDAATLASIPAPPTGAAAAHDLRRVRAAVATRTPQLNQLAQLDDVRDGWDTWDRAISEIRATEGSAQAVRAAQLVQQAHRRASDVMNAAKAEYVRQRPLRVDPSLPLITGDPLDNPSYPSGHATGAYAAATVLAAFLPARAAELMDAARQVAYSRVYAAVHFPSDVAMGARLASRTAVDVLRRAGMLQAASVAGTNAAAGFTPPTA
jgi:hypothetical protein